MSIPKKILLCLLPPLLVVSVFLQRDIITNLAGHFYTCYFLRATGFYCPGCGNTRSVLALLHFDIPAALGYNITPVLAAVLALLAYIELLFWAVGKPQKIFPRRPWFWISLGCLIAVYFIIRNFFPFLTQLPLPPSV